jgi:hypothetical protein
MSETRKLAAILVADIVGYSRLAAADEETRELVRFPVTRFRQDLLDGLDRRRSRLRGLLDRSLPSNLRH